jgi:hypothetical protein
MVTAGTDRDPRQMQIEKAEALIALARLRLRPPEREQVIGALQSALDELRQPAAIRHGGEASQVERAEAKAVQAEADREEKRRPYEADPLFMYLWRRRYGTRDYRASNFVRYFDRKVAHLIDFETARTNYAMLLELPERLREHAERLKAAGLAEPGLDPARRIADLQRRPGLTSVEAGAAEEADEVVIRRRIEEIDAALARVHHPVVAKE